MQVRNRLGHGGPIPCPQGKTCVVVSRGWESRRNPIFLVSQQELQAQTYDNPPGNVTMIQCNNDAIQAYSDICEAFRLFKKGFGPQPRDPDTNDIVMKIPSAHKPIKRYLRCHCRQNCDNQRTGQKCAVDYFYDGQPFSSGECPLCLCVCNAFVPLKDYVTILMVSTLPDQQRTQESQREAARNYLEHSLDVNMMQQRASNKAYTEMMPGSIILDNIKLHL